MESSADRLLPSWRYVPVLYGLWFVPALVMATRATLTTEGADLAAWGSRLAGGIWYWLAWATLCPLVYRLYVARPFSRGQRATSLLYHAAAALGVVVALALLAAILRVTLFGRPETWSYAFRRELFSRPALGLHLLHFSKYWVVLGGLAFVREMRLRRASERRAAEAGMRASRLETELSNATLQALRARLDPHFLFNALNSLSSLVEQGENRRAVRMIGVLGGLLRRTLDAPREQLVPLADELDLVRRYLELEQLRFGDRLRVAFEVDAGCEGVPVPPLVLQPLVENVVRHGVSRRDEPVTVTIGARDVGGELELVVEDDGPGLPAGWSLRRQAGVGLRTTAERLRLCYGGQHRLSVAPAPAGGTRCSIRLPRAAGDTAMAASGGG